MKRLFIVGLLTIIPGGFSNHMSEVRYQSEGLQLTLRIEKVTAKEVVLKAKIRNTTNQQVYIASNPVRVDGSMGFYLSLDSKDRILRIESRVFGLDRPSPYSDQTAVAVKELASMAEVEETITIVHEQLETVPPVDLHINRKRIDLTTVKTLQVRYGFFFENSGIREVLKNKLYGPWINGREQVRVGTTDRKHLCELQNLVSDSVELSFR
jgi:hypothetical protein